MKRLLWLGILSVSFLVLPAPAGAWTICGPDLPPIHIDAGCKWHLHVYCGGGCPTQLEPWYLYYPYEAHFQSPAPVGFPNWPAPVAAGPSVPPVAPVAPAVPPMPSAWGQPRGPATVQPAGYIQPVGYPNPQVPSYWYERR
jgi:hypothetical protein